MDVRILRSAEDCCDCLRDSELRPVESEDDSCGTGRSETSASIPMRVQIDRLPAWLHCNGAALISRHCNFEGRNHPIPSSPAPELTFRLAGHNFTTKKSRLSKCVSLYCLVARIPTALFENALKRQFLYHINEFVRLSACSASETTDQVWIASGMTLHQTRSLMFCGGCPLSGRGSVVAWGTMLKAGKSRIRFPMRSLDFAIDLIFPAALLWPWGQLSL
jgi:hypothetical protein